MKKIFLAMAIAAMSVFCFNSCTYESFDTFVEWGFAEDTNSEVVYGLESLLPSAQVIINAFDKAFLSQYDDLNMGHEALMRSQSGKKTAIKNAKATAELAHSTIPSGHVCPVDYIFVVRIKYDSDKYETVWSHDYRVE